MAVLGFDLSPLRSALSDLDQGIRSGVQAAEDTASRTGGDFLSYLSGLAQTTPGPLQGTAGQTLAQVSQSPPTGLSANFMGQLADYARQTSGLNGPAFGLLGNLYQPGGGAPGGGGFATTAGMSKTWADLGAYGNQLAANAATKAATTPTPGGSSGGAGGYSSGPSTGLDPNVAKWSTQAQQTFGDLLDPDIMLAIMTNESRGNPGAYNKAGNAYGLFQQLNFGDGNPNWASDVNGQFQAARTLAQQKLDDINAAYAKNGLNPDQRTRALDFAGAWGGYFDYTTGRFDPTAMDNLVGGQTGAQFSQIFLGNYDKIKAGRQQAAPPGGVSAGLAGVTPGTSGQIMQEFGVTPTSEGYRAAGNTVYGYGASYGMAGGGHPGVDWAVPMGTKVATPLGGTVSVVGNDHGTGYYYQNTMGGGADPDHSGEFAVTLDNGDILILGHLSQINAQVGQRVNAGALIGLSGGSDGSHVHVEYRQRQADGSYRVIDPRSVLGGGN